MLVGLAFALLAPGRFELPRGGFQVGQAVTGVAIGTFLQSSTLTGLGSRWIAVALVSVATLAVTIAAGLLLARLTPLHRPPAPPRLGAAGAPGAAALGGGRGGGAPP